MREIRIRVFDEGRIDRKLTEIAKDIAKFCMEKYKLELTDIDFYLVDAEELYSIVASRGWMVHPQHWTLGQEYLIQKKAHELGYWQIYEIVIPSGVWEDDLREPTQAFIYRGDTLVDIKLVMAHVFGHVHMFEKNWKLREFRPKSPYGFMSRIRDRIAQIEQMVGEDELERIMDIGYSMANLLIDLYPTDTIEHHKDIEISEEFFISPEEKRKKIIEKREGIIKAKEFPEKRDYDVLKFIATYSPKLRDWEKEVLYMIWESARYIYSWALVRILGEGFAALVDLKYCLDAKLPIGETFEWLKHRTRGTYQPGSCKECAHRTIHISPYWLGMNLLLYIMEKWDTGRIGFEYENIKDAIERRGYDIKLGRGWDKVLEVVATNTDYTFIDKYFTEEFFRERANFLFVYAGDEPKDGEREEDTYTIISRQYKDVKNTLLFRAYNAGMPRIAVEKGGGNYNNRGELFLVHDISGYESLGIRPEQLTLHPNKTIEVLLKVLYASWGRPVYLKTVDRQGKPIILKTENGEKVEKVEVSGSR